MRRKLWLGVMAVIILGVFTAMSVAAAETVSEKYRVVYHFFKVERIEVDDVPGHVIGVVDGRGLIFLDTGEVGTELLKIMFDYTNGSGPFQGYRLDTFQDGSSRICKGQGTTTALPSEVSTFNATFTYIKGAGRFKGIKGTGSLTGKRMSPLIPGGPTDSYLDWEGEYTLP